MQFQHTGLDPTHHALLHEEWEKLNHTPPHKKTTLSRSELVSPPHACSPELSPVVAVLPGLIRLVNECTDRPVTKFRPTIQRLIQEQLFIDVCGDCIVDPHQNVQIDSYVELTICVLVRIRENTLGQNEWSDAPVTPQMFG
jgi:hypothetical protein